MSAWMDEVKVVMESSKDRLISMYKAPLLAFWTKIAPTGEITSGELFDALKSAPAHLREIRNYTKTKGGVSTGKFSDVEILNEDRMTVMASEYADGQIAKVTSKILAKLEEIDTVTEVRVNLAQMEFTFVGERAGKGITLTQQAVFKVSSKNTPFVQFPARFHVDGKPMSEAAYKAMFA